MSDKAYIVMLVKYDDGTEHRFSMSHLCDELDEKQHNEVDRVVDLAQERLIARHLKYGANNLLDAPDSRSKVIGPVPVQFCRWETDGHEWIPDNPQWRDVKPEEFRKIMESWD